MDARPDQPAPDHDPDDEDFTGRIRRLRRRIGEFFRSGPGWQLLIAAINLTIALMNV